MSTRDIVENKPTETAFSNTAEPTCPTPTIDSLCVFIFISFKTFYVYCNPFTDIFSKNEFHMLSIKSHINTII